LIGSFHLIAIILLNTNIFFIINIAATAELRMHLLEVSKDFVLGDSLLAFEADEVPVLAVDIQVFLLIWGLAEGHPATLHWANVGFFQGVGAQMVKEVVPFSEIHATVLLITGVYIGSATGLRIEEFDMTEGPSVGHVSLPIEHLHVYVLSPFTLKRRVERQIKLLSQPPLQCLPWFRPRLNLRSLSLFKNSIRDYAVALCGLDRGLEVFKGSDYGVLMEIMGDWRGLLVVIVVWMRVVRLTEVIK
jgi:hypothetical protein